MVLGSHGKDVREGGRMICYVVAFKQDEITGKGYLASSLKIKKFCYLMDRQEGLKGMSIMPEITNLLFDTQEHAMKAYKNFQKYGYTPTMINIPCYAE